MTNPYRFFIGPSLALLMLVLAASSARSQTPALVRVGGPHIAAYVTTGERAGRLMLFSGSRGGDSMKILYATNPAFVTSNLIFRVERGGSVTYYHNQPPGYFPWEPRTVAGETATTAFRAYDSLIAGADTLTVVWSDLDDYDVRMRLIPEKLDGERVGGGEMLIEFEVTDRGPWPGTLGIAMMLDLFNSTGLAGDRVELITNRATVLQGDPRFVASGANVPSQYHYGVLHQSAAGHRFAVHRLAGRTRSGIPLDEPELFAAGSWESFRHYSWELPSGDDPMLDAATIVRWGVRSGSRIIRTSIGINDPVANRELSAYDTALTALLRAPRVVAAGAAMGAATRHHVVTADVGNVAETHVGGYVRLVIERPGGEPAWARLDGGATTMRQLSIGRRGVQNFWWTLEVDSTADAGDLRLALELSDDGSQWRRASAGGVATVTIERDAPVAIVDSVAPGLVRIDSTGSPATAWTLAISDRSGGAPTWGIDEVVLEWGDGDSTSFDVSLGALAPCDTGTVTLRVGVRDTLRSARAVVRATDCSGNVARDTLRYAPRISSVVSSDAADRWSCRLEPSVAGASQSVLVRLDGRPPHGAIDLRVVDAGGRVVAGRRLSESEMAEGAARIDTDRLVSGMYLLECAGVGGVVRARLLVVR